jgi:hypothetical protein
MIGSGALALLVKSPKIYVEKPRDTTSTAAFFALILCNSPAQSEHSCFNQRFLLETNAVLFLVGNGNNVVVREGAR